MKLLETNSLLKCQYIMLSLVELKRIARIFAWLSWYSNTKEAAILAYFARILARHVPATYAIYQKLMFVMLQM